ESNRPAILAGFAAAFVILGGGGIGYLVKASKDRSPFLKDTIAVLKGDEHARPGGGGRRVTEMETLRRRRELVLLSAQLQRATLVRRLDNVQRHPMNTVVGLAASLASVPLLFKVGTLVASRVAGRNRKRRMTSNEKRGFS